MAGTLYTLSADRAPREAFEVAFMTLGNEPPGYELRLIRPGVKLNQSMLDFAYRVVSRYAGVGDH